MGHASVAGRYNRGSQLRCGRGRGVWHGAGLCCCRQLAAPRDALEGEGTSEAAPVAVRQAVGGGCRSGWGRLLSVTNAIEAGTWRQGGSGWA